MSITINGTTGIAGVDGSAATPSVQGADANTGMFFPAADTVAITTAGVEAMRVDSTGLVGVGTAAPTAKMHLVDQNNAGWRYEQYNDGDGTNFRNFRAKGTIAAPTAVTTDSRLGSFLAGGYGVTGGFSGLNGGMSIWAAENYAATAAGTYLTFGTAAIGANPSGGGTERMRIGPAGQIGIGGANYGTSGQVLTSGGSGAAPSWASRGFASTTITNTSRASATVFQNTTNGTMLVTVVGQNNGAIMYAGATAGGIFQVSRQNATYTAVSCMVPPGWYYRADYSVLGSWIEGQ
jgi:hypothetical protein